MTEPEIPLRLRHIQRVVMWEQIMAAAKEKAAEHRAALTADARAELAKGTRPTWNTDLATVSLPLSHETVYVSDEQALIEWFRQADAAQIETIEKVKPAAIGELLRVVSVADGKAFIPTDPDDPHPRAGDVVPGLSVRPGGLPGTLSFTPQKAAKAVAADAARLFLDDVEKRIGGPVTLAERSDD